MTGLVSQPLTSSDQVTIKEIFSKTTSKHVSGVIKLNAEIRNARQGWLKINKYIKKVVDLNTRWQENSLLLLELAEKIPSIQAAKIKKLTPEQKKRHSVVLNRLGYYEQIFREEAKKMKQAEIDAAARILQQLSSSKEVFSLQKPEDSDDIVDVV